MDYNSWYYWHRTYYSGISFVKKECPFRIYIYTVERAAQFDFSSFIFEKEFVKYEVETVSLLIYFIAEFRPKYCQLRFYWAMFLLNLLPNFKVVIIWMHKQATAWGGWGWRELNLTLVFAVCLMPLYISMVVYCITIVYLKNKKTKQDKTKKNMYRVSIKL